MGLFLLVREGSAKHWVQRLAIRGRRRDIGLGSPPVVTLAEARDRALENKRLARDGGDPLQARREAQAVLTFEEAARRVKQRIGMVLKWAVAQGWRQDNPADAIGEALPKDRQQKARRKALPYQDVAGCMAAVQASQAGESTKLAFRLLVLTASRSAEVRLARWGQVDWQAEGGPVWIRPETVMKAKVAHAVPLSRAAVAVLHEARALGDADNPDALIFPGTVRGKPLSDATLLKLVREQGFDVDVHGFRTSFRTWAQEQTNFPREVAEAALAHTIRDKAEAAYARSDLMEKRRALGEAWAAWLAEEPGGKVVRLPGVGA